MEEGSDQREKLRNKEKEILLGLELWRARFFTGHGTPIYRKQRKGGI